MAQPTTIRPLSIVLLALLTLQLLLVSSHKGWIGLYLSPVFFLGAGVAIGLLPLQRLPRASGKYTAPFWLWWIPLLGLLGNAWEVRDIIHQFVLDPRASDIIPSIQHMYVDRIFAGEQVYQPYYGFGYEFHPTYLPLFWAPYLLSGAFGIDHRWLAFGLLAMPLLVQSYRMSKQAAPLLERATKMILPWGLTWWFIRYNPDMVGYTLEMMVAGYFVWFVLSTLAEKYWINAGGWLLTLLSRYANLLFVPLYAIIGWREKGWRPALYIAGIVIGGIVVLYVLPFLSNNWQAFGLSYQYYSDATLVEWQDRPDLGRPYHLYNGVGMAYWFYQLWPGELVERITAMRYTQIALCLLTTLILGGWYIRQSRTIHWRWFLVAAFQVYMTVFYVFVQIPYAYLYIVPVLVSMMVVLEVPWTRHSADTE